MDFTGKRITPDEVYTAYMVTKLIPRTRCYVENNEHGRYVYTKKIPALYACAIGATYLLNFEPEAYSGDQIRDWAYEQYGKEYVRFFVMGFDAIGHNAAELPKIEAYQDGCEARRAVFEPTKVEEPTSQEFLKTLELAGV